MGRCVWREPSFVVENVRVRRLLLGELILTFEPDWGLGTEGTLRRQAAKWLLEVAGLGSYRPLGL